MHTTFDTMGTVASLDLPGIEYLPIVEEVFRDADELFSLYRPSSELSRIARAELHLCNADPQLRDAYAAAHEWSAHTHGAFTANRPDGTIDLNGIVKARAIARATDLLIAEGVSDFSINVGGDIQCTGLDPLTREPWSIGVSDPANRAAVLFAIRLREPRRAIATSGYSERGEHIWRFGRTAESDFVQVTVVADDIVTADVLATAIVAGGPQLLDYASENWGIDVFSISRDGTMLATPGLRASLLG